MKDMVYLSLGDTNVLFGEYEGDTRAYCEGMRAAFNYLGIDSEVSEQIVTKMEAKPTKVQRVFMLRILGLGTGTIAALTGIPGRTVRRYAHERVDDVRQILRDWVKPVPIGDTWPN